MPAADRGAGHFDATLVLVEVFEAEAEARVGKRRINRMRRTSRSQPAKRSTSPVAGPPRWRIDASRTGMA